MLCLSALACQPASPGPDPLRFVDLLPPASRSVLIIDGELKSVLPSSEAEQRFEVEGAPQRPVLAFSVGLGPFQKPRAVRFEVLLQPKQADPALLYAKEVDRAGWIEERVDLADRDLNGATLIFRRTVLRGFEEPPPFGVWGNPMLLSSAPPRRPSVILVSLDTLRADMVGVYGREQARTPALDGLAAQGVQYQRAYAPSTWTVPSHASLFYGAYLPDTPAVLRGGKLVPETTDLPDRPIAETLREAGYLTAGFTGGGFLGFPWDFWRGFDSYYGYPPQGASSSGCNPLRFDGPEVFRRATEWLERHHGDPFFLFVHTYDVHDRCPFYNPNDLAPGANPFDAGPSLERADRRELLRYYDRLIEETDRRLAGLLATVDSLGLRDHTLVIVTSDHGEALSEHGASSHGCTLKPYEELARVPLLVRFPGHAKAGERVAEPVSLIDVASSILALLGLPREPKIPGGVLPGLGLAATPGPSRPVYNQCKSALAVWRGDHKLITSHDQRYRDEIYDLSKDPNERNDLGSGDPNAAVLAEDARTFWRTAVVLQSAPGVKAPQKPLDPETQQRLRDLGYLK
jgi:arylsulfatase A-like enzyme